jgi:uncharacterized membrane protein YkgB
VRRENICDDGWRRCKKRQVPKPCPENVVVLDIVAALVLLGAWILNAAKAGGRIVVRVGSTLFIIIIPPCYLPNDPTCPGRSGGVA